MDIVEKEKKEMIVILEDEENRKIAMKEIIKEIGYEETYFFDEAEEMIEWLKGNMEKVILISLDHDLGPNRERNGKIYDPGNGRDVVNFLISQNVKCPIIIHSSNYLAVTGMILALESSSWSVHRVIPFDNTTWVYDSWSPLFCRLLGF